MGFVGAIESFGRDKVTGWASYVVSGVYKNVEVVIRLRDGSTLAPEAYVDRGRSRGFIFSFTSDIKALKWSEILDHFVAVVAVCSAHPDAGEWQVPLYKSVLLQRHPDNPTSLLTDQLKKYCSGPNLGGRIAAFTIAYNEHLVLPLWARYYASCLGAENLFVIDQGSDRPYDDLLPQGVNIIRLPRENFDNWLLVRLVELLQRFLLESYESVLYTDSDEFVCASPEALDGRSLAEFLKQLPSPVGVTTGYDLLHAVSIEKPFDREQPVLSQRRYMRRQPYMDKPLISRIPLNWVPGFHSAVEGGAKIRGLYMLHFRWFDLDHALAKGGFYRSSEWSQFDVDNRIASYQRQGEEDIIKLFRSYDRIASELTSATFNEHDQNTVVPAWMQRAIYV